MRGKAIRIFVLLFAAGSMGSLCRIQPADPLEEGAPCVQADECAAGLTCCSQAPGGDPVCSDRDDCAADPDCPICAKFTLRYHCSQGSYVPPDCAVNDLCFDRDECADYTFAKQGSGNTYASSDGFLVGTLDGHTFTWRGETDSDPGVDTGYVEVGVLEFSDDFKTATGTSCYVYDDTFDPAPGETRCDPLDGAPPWQFFGDCTQTFRRGSAVPGPPADVGCCTDAPAVHEECGG